MAYATDIRSNANGGLMARITEFRASLAERRAKARVYRTTLRELQALSARDLADLGIAPSMIRSIAFEAAYGQN